MDALKPSSKRFEISKWEVWEAYRQAKANRGAPGASGVTLEEFETDLKGNLYKIWNRMSSGNYFPPPVMAVEIPTPHGGGVRTLGVPTISDRVAQTVVARRLEAKVEPIFHPDSYGYRPNRSALDAVKVCQQWCWKTDQKFFDSVDSWPTTGPDGLPSEEVSNEYSGRIVFITSDNGARPLRNAESGRHERTANSHRVQQGADHHPRSACAA
ncbi:reverse transcriptase domain-containing protein [Nocardia sp. BMG51109]|uniref:reverse transcriptase domain-containing protein n=1 Tax=Nocardia sp. BMG51109 TaxID=1056816 RepID=UPI0004B60275|nr:reverse transcriptase domain-containing protein [Nocardia sp. BMG51109]